MTKIAILLHANEQPDRTHRFLVWGLRNVWVEDGFQVELVNGPDPAVLDADVVFAHVDLTVTPEPYRALVARHPRVVNGGVTDITKRAISGNLLDRGDDWPGPVIVKTNLNAAGSPERRLLEQRLVDRARRWADRVVRSKGPPGYHLFPSLDAVPEDLFADDDYVVERFLPEQDDGLYCLRTYFFLGDRECAFRVKSPEPVIKASNTVAREDAPVLDEFRAARRRLGLDYGKLDFVLHDSAAVLIDANRTPSTVQHPPGESALRRNRHLAPAIREWCPA